MRNIGKRTKNSKIKELFTTYLRNNKREYIIVITIFLIGLVVGVIFINKASQIQVEEITGYLQHFVEQLKAQIPIDKGQLLKETLISNFILAITLWFVGSTVVGIPIVYGIIAYRGFCIGYTISAAIATLGMNGGIVFSLTSILFQNIIFIPCILALAVSGMKLYQSIVKDKRKENIKIEITRHTICCVLLLILLEVSAFLEVYVSTNLLQICAKYM